MAAVLNRITLEYRASVNTPDFPPEDWLINPDLSAVRGLPQRYWRIEKGAVVAMTEAEQAAVDDAEAIALKEARVETVDRALVSAILETVGHAGKETDVETVYRSKL